MADEHRHDIAELYTKITLGEMRRSLPHFNWPLFFNRMFKDLHEKVGWVERRVTRLGEKISKIEN